MYHTIYRITNLINGKIYIGCHQTNDLDDDYMGSGKVLKKSIEKYGLGNFQKDYLAVFDSPEEMFEMESQLVNEEFVKRNDTYNIKEGGYGGWDFVNQTLTREQRQQGGKTAGEMQRQRCLIDIDYRAALFPAGPVTFKGKKHTEEAKRKIGSANAIHQQGAGNSQYGSMWITDGKMNKKVMNDSTLPDGWKRGRISNGQRKDS